LGNSQGLGIPLKLFENVVGSLVRLLHLFCVCGVVRTRQEVVADASKVVFAGKGRQFGQLFDFHEQIDCFWFFIVIDEFGDDLVDQFVDILHRLFILNTFVVLFADLTSQTAQILVTPRDKIPLRALETVLQTLVRVFFFGADHAEHRDKICELFFEIPFCQLLKESLYFLVVRTQEFERLGHRSHSLRRSRYFLLELLKSFHFD